jgi:hypothetical protein
MSTHMPYALDDHGDSAATATVLPTGEFLQLSQRKSVASSCQGGSHLDGCCTVIT